MILNHTRTARMPSCADVVFHVFLLSPPMRHMLMSMTRPRSPSSASCSKICPYRVPRHTSSPFALMHGTEGIFPFCLSLFPIVLFLLRLWNFCLPPVILLMDDPVKNHPHSLTDFGMGYHFFSLLLLLTFPSFADSLTDF